MKKKNLIFVLRIVATILIFWLVFWKVDFRRIAGVFAGADIIFLLPILLLRPLFFFVRGLKIWQILRFSQQEQLPVMPIIGWFFVSCSIGVFTPAGLGDFSIVYFTRKYNVKSEDCIAAVFLEKAMTVCITVLLSVCGILLYFQIQRTAVFGLALAFIVGTAILAIVYSKWSRINRFLEQQKGRLFAALTTIKNFVVNHPIAFLGNLSLAVVQTIIVTAQLWLSFHFLRLDTHFTDVFWLSCISRLANQLPITVGGLGVYEGAVMIVFQQVGISTEISLAAALVGRLITWLTTLFIVIWIVWFRSRKL